MTSALNLKRLFILKIKYHFISIAIFITALASAQHQDSTAIAMPSKSGKVLVNDVKLDSLEWFF